MINAGTVQVKLFADTRQYMTAMTAAKNQMKTMGVSAQAFAATSILAFAAFTGAASKMATDFDKRLREISTLIIGVTENDIKNMSREIRDLASVTGKSFDDIGKAKYDIISAGFTDMAESATLLNTAARLAVGGVTSVTNSADLLTSSLNSFQLSGFKAEEAADILFTTVRLGKTTMDELVGSVGRVFPTAKTLGASLADVGAAMATITAGGIKTYEAATYLNQAFTKLGAPSNTAAKAMAEYGVRVFKTEKGMLDLSRTIAQFQGYDLETMRKFFPEIRAIKAILAMANNMEFLNRALDQTTNSTGATQKAFDKMSKSWSVQLSKKVMQFKDQMVELGDKIMPDVVDVFDEFIDILSSNIDKYAKDISNLAISVLKLVPALTDVLMFLSKFADELIVFVVAKNLSKALIGIVGKLSAAFLAAYDAVIVRFGMSMPMLAANATKMITTFRMLSLTMAQMAATALANPMVQVGLVIASVILLIKSAKKEMNRLKELAKPLIQKQIESIDVELDISANIDKVTLGGSSKQELDVGELLGFGKSEKVIPDSFIADGEMLTFQIPTFIAVGDAFSYIGNEADDSNKKVGSFGDSVKKTADEIKKNMGKGAVGSNIDLYSLSVALDNIYAFNDSLKELGLNTFDVNKNLFELFGVDIKDFGEALSIIEASGNSLSDMSEIDTSNIRFNMNAFLNIIEILGLKGKTIEDVRVWYDKLMETFSDSEDPTALENLVSAMGKASKIDMQGDFGFLEFITDMDVTSLEDAVRLVGVWGVSLEDATKAGIYTKEEMEALLDIFNKLADNKISLDDLMIHFDLKEAKDEIESFGKTIIDEFSYIAQSISSTMADAFTEIALSGRVAMQELESYNKGLTSNFRTSAEIQEEAWSNMWNNILTDTIRTVADMLIQVALLTGGIVLANILTDGVFGALVKGTTKISETTSKLGKFFYNMFAGDDASGLSKALTKAVIGDGIVTPQGQVIQTDPRDFIIATTDPNSLVNGSGGGGNTYKIYAMDSQSFEDFLKRNPQAVARGVGHSVERRNLRLKSSGNQVRAEY